jgi:nitrous oxide reductase accessory protein NosL
MSKFHLIHVDDQESGSLEEADAFSKASGGKVLLFKSVATYVSKLIGSKSEA